MRRIARAAAAKKCLVDQRGGLQGLPLVLALHVRAGQAAHFVVDEGEELLGGAGVAGVDGGQELGDLVGILGGHGGLDGRAGVSLILQKRRNGPGVRTPGAKKKGAGC
jgi:hypothetical protein